MADVVERNGAPEGVELGLEELTVPVLAIEGVGLDESLVDCVALTEIKGWGVTEREGRRT